MTSGYCSHEAMIIYSNRLKLPFLNIALAEYRHLLCLLEDWIP